MARGNDDVDERVTRFEPDVLHVNGNSLSKESGKNFLDWDFHDDDRLQILALNAVLNS